MPRKERKRPNKPGKGYSFSPDGKACPICRHWTAKFWAIGAAADKHYCHRCDPDAPSHRKRSVSRCVHCEVPCRRNLLISVFGMATVRCICRSCEHQFYCDKPNDE